MRVFYPIGWCNAKIPRRRPSGIEGDTLAGPRDAAQPADRAR